MSAQQARASRPRRSSELTARTPFRRRQSRARSAACAGSDARAERGRGGRRGRRRAKRKRGRGGGDDGHEDDICRAHSDAGCTPPASPYAPRRQPRQRASALRRAPRHRYGVRCSARVSAAGSCRRLCARQTASRLLPTRGRRVAVHRQPLARDAAVGRGRRRPHGPELVGGALRRARRRLAQRARRGASGRSGPRSGGAALTRSRL